MALDFEQPVLELEQKIDELRQLSSHDHLNIADEVLKLQEKANKLLTNIYGNLTPWQKVQVARHEDRPHFLDYQKNIFQDFVPLAGDRLFAEDRAIVAGFASFDGRSVMVMGQQKGRDTESRLKHNFGMPRPEGYRKAQRLMHLAEKFRLPLITFIDTAGAYPGFEAEDRGQAEAIAKCIEVSLELTVPIISIVIGEGGSGGAIAIGVANRVIMLEHSVYSVISPEGCASILWHNKDRKQEAAAAQKLTAQDLEKFGIIDQIIPEPLGGAHRNPDTIIADVKEVIQKNLMDLEREVKNFQTHRYEKFMMTQTFEVE